MGKMKKAGQSGFSFAESLITVTILAFVAIAAIGITAKKNTFNVNVKAKHGTYECFRNDADTPRERYTYYGAQPLLAGETPKHNPETFTCGNGQKCDCVFVQPAYVNTICINISGGGGGGSTGTPALDRIGGSAGETKSMCLSNTANSGTATNHVYKIKIGSGGLSGKNGGASTILRAGTADTVVLSVAGGISGIDVVTGSDLGKGEPSGLDEVEVYGSGGDAGQRGKGGYVGITW